MTNFSKYPGETQGDQQHDDTAQAVNIAPLVGLDRAIILGVLAVTAEETKNAEQQQRNRQQDKRPLG